MRALSVLTAVAILAVFAVGFYYQSRLNEAQQDSERMQAQLRDLQDQVNRAAGAVPGDLDSDSPTHSNELVLEGDTVPSAAAENSMSPEEQVDLAKRRAAKLAARARQKLEAGEGEEFADLCFALLDLGPEGRKQLLGILADADMAKLGEIDRSIQADRLAQAKLVLAITQRLPLLGELFDDALARPGQLDSATLAALQMINEYAIPTTLSDEERVAQLSQIMNDAMSPDLEASERVLRDAFRGAVGALAKFGSPEAIAIFEGYLKDGEVAHHHNALIGGLLEMDTPESVAALQSLFHTDDGELREKILQQASRSSGAEANSLQWDALEVADSLGQRMELWERLASRPENIPRVLERMRGGDMPETERLAILYAMTQSADASLAKASWELFDSASSERERHAILFGFVRGGEPRAGEIVIEELQRGADSEELSEAVTQLSSRQARIHSSSLQQIASDLGRSIRVRTAAARSLGRVDSKGAVDALMTRYVELGNREQQSLVTALAHLPGVAATKALREVAQNTHWDAVRNTANRLLEIR